MNEDRMNGIMDVIRNFPSSLREISDLTMIPSTVVESYINILLEQGLAEISHVRKLKMSKVIYYRLVHREKRF